MNRLIASLAALLILSACCTGSGDPDCTPAEREQALKDEIPQLMAVQNGVKLYRLNHGTGGYPVYFTTPCGDVSWDRVEHYGKGQTRHVPQHVNGEGCDQ